MNLSAVLSVYNEEKSIKDCLTSVAFADEIIVVDNHSTDATVKLAREFTSAIFKKQNNPRMLNLNKNFGFKKATSDWILSLDADERISEELREEIEQIISHPSPSISQTVGFLIPRKNIIFGKWIKHGLWHPDYQLRLFRRGKGKFPGIHNHELLEVKGPVRKLDNYLIHYNYSTVNEYLNKIAYYYSDNEADNFIKTRKKLHWYDSIRMPASDFLTNFFAREGYKDGLHGLLLAIFQAFYTVVVFAKVWEKQGFWEYNSDNFLKDTQKEISQKNKELSYWVNRVRIRNAPFFSKLLLKMRSKLLP